MGSAGHRRGGRRPMTDDSKTRKAIDFPGEKATPSKGSSKPNVVRSRLQDDGTYFTRVDDEQIKAILATDNVPFIEGLVWEIGNAGSTAGALNDDKTNYMLSMIEGIAPKDTVETLLAAQMAAVHRATMDYARRLSQATSAEVRTGHERALNRLARTFTSQIEALQKHRSKGKQKIVVQHIHVSGNAQAVVGDVQHGGKGG